MFYEPKIGHDLPHDPFYSLIVPRPIGWITTISLDGVINLAPFSFYNGAGLNPPQVLFHNSFVPQNLSGRVPGTLKDSVTNVEETGEFVVNLVTWELRNHMNESARHVNSSIDETNIAGLEIEPSIIVKPPRVKESPAHLECKHFKTVELLSNGPEFKNLIIFGEVVGIHINEKILSEGIVDISKFKPISKGGYYEYSVVDNIFTMTDLD